MSVQTICQLFSFDNFPALERVVLHCGRAGVA